MEPHRTSLLEYFSSLPVLTYKKDDVLMHPHENPDGAYLVITGIVEQYDVSSSGNKIIIGHFNRGMFASASWSIAGVRNRFSLEAITNTSAQFISTQALRACLTTEPTITFQYLKGVILGADSLRRKFILAATRTALQRLVAELISEARYFGQPTRFNPSMTFLHIRQIDLAGRSGLGRETVARELHHLAVAGYVTRVKHGMVVSIPELEAYLAEL